MSNARSSGSTKVSQLALYTVRWLAKGREGCCYIRGHDDNDVLTEFQTNASFYGCPVEDPLVVLISPTRRTVRRIHGRV